MAVVSSDRKRRRFDEALLSVASAAPSFGSRNREPYRKAASAAPVYSASLPARFRTGWRSASLIPSASSAISTRCTLAVPSPTFSMLI